MSTAFIIKFNGQDVDIPESGLSDLVAFEKHFGIASSVLEPEMHPKVGPDGAPVIGDDGEPEMEIVSEFRLEWICFLVWRALRKQGVIDKSVAFDDDFLDQIEDIRQPGAEKSEVDELDPPVPAQPAA